MLSENILKILRAGRSKALDIVEDSRATLQSISEAGYDKEHIYAILKTSEKLSKSEKDVIKKKYGHVIPCVSRGYDFFRAMKRLDEFNSDYIPSSFYYPFLLRVLNPANVKRLLCNKSLLKLIFQTEVKHPITPLRSIAGVYFNSDNKPISPIEAVEIIKSYNSPLVYKPSTDTNSGIGIKLIHGIEIDQLIDKLLSRDVFKPDNIDFVIQIPVRQSEETAILNPTSLNCMRITTLNLNERVSTHSMTIKCGPQNSFVDNIGSGKRGVIVGISREGYLNKYGFYGNGEKCSQHNNIIFEGIRIRNFHKVVEAALKLHGMIQSCHVIGWDIALDHDNEPVLIEGNTTYPGISLEQMCSGPIFGDRADEVIEYVSRHPKNV